MRAQATSAALPNAVFHGLSDLLTNGPVDYMDESNTHIISVQPLLPIAFTGRRRRSLLAASGAWRMRMRLEGVWESWSRV